MSKIKAGKKGGVELVILKGCAACDPNGGKGDYSFGNSDGGGKNPGSSNGNTGKPKQGGSNNSSPGKNPKTESGTAGSGGSGGASGTKSGSNPSGNDRHPDSPETNDPVASPNPVATQEQQVTETLILAVPGIQQAIREFRADQRQRASQPVRFDTKPVGFDSGDFENNREWVNDLAMSSMQSDWKQELNDLWGDVKDLFTLSSQAADAFGYEQESSGFRIVSQTMGYLEAAGHLDNWSKHPENFDNRAALVNDAISLGAEFAGAVGTTFGQFGPPVDLYEKTFEGSLNRMNALLTTGNPGDELQVMAPLTDWFGSMIGMGNLGTRERNYRMESHLSFMERKDRYGYVEAAKQTLFNWLHE
ncbi:MAG: hypothetical protein SFV52_08150 [Saprospiraceae bacterium]|nr:hypothetical protein [Saprospiraceae bacterium]